jgi:hypothetical protein
MITFPPRPPVVYFPKPSAPGNAIGESFSGIFPEEIFGPHEASKTAAQKQQRNDDLFRFIIKLLVKKKVVSESRHCERREARPAESDAAISTYYGEIASAKSSYLGFLLAMTRF